MNAAQHRTAGSGVAVAQEAVWDESDRNLNEQHVRSAPVWKGLRSRASSKDFLASFVSPLSAMLLDWTGRQLQQTKWGRSRALGNRS